MSEHRRKPSQPQGGGRAAARRGQPQPGATAGRREAPRDATGSPSDSYDSGVERARSAAVPRHAGPHSEETAEAGAEPPTARDQAVPEEGAADAVVRPAPAGPDAAEAALPSLPRNASSTTRARASTAPLAGCRPGSS